MPRTKTRGHIQFCIDLSLDAGPTELSEHRTLAQMAAQMADLFRRFQISVTWAVSDFAATRMLPASLLSDSSSEIALLATSQWASPSSTRQSVMQHVDSFGREAESNGIRVTSLVNRDSELSDFTDLFPKQGISTIRERPSESMVRHVVRDPSAPRANLWRAIPTCSFPHKGGWWNQIDRSFGVKKVLRRGLVKKSTEHVAISMSALVAHPRSESMMKSLGRVLETLSKLEANGRIRSETLRDTENRWRPMKVHSPQRSALRPAA